jgi:hypothetical protein
VIPENFFIGGGASETIMTPVGFVLLLLASGLIILLPRRLVVVPVLLGIFLVPMGLVVVIAGFHLMNIRILVLAGWLRIIRAKLSGEHEILPYGFGGIDRAFAYFAVVTAIAFVLLWGGWGAIANRIGFLWTTIGGYFLIRHLLRDEEDCYRTIKTFIWISLICALGMLYERSTQHNLFGTLVGGVPEISLIREGKIRSQAAFGQPIPAGMFGATLLPLCLLLAKGCRSKGLAAVGIVSCLIMIYTPAASTPLLAVAGAVVALCCWSLRSSMRMLRWAAVVSGIGLQLIMNAPIWFLIARVDVTGSSSSYHRAALVDTFVRHFFDWWLVGTRDIGSWGWGMFDLSNQYVAVGEGGGLLALVFFIAQLSRSFRSIGSLRKHVQLNRRKEWVAWLLGVTLFSHVVGFFGISYWDQLQVTWWTLLAMIIVFYHGWMPTSINGIVHVRDEEGILSAH